MPQFTCEELLALYRAHPKCPLEWMRSHDGSPWNEYADSLATAWRRDVLLHGRRLRHSIPSEVRYRRRLPIEHA